MKALAAALVVAVVAQGLTLSVTDGTAAACSYMQPAARSEVLEWAMKDSDLILIGTVLEEAIDYEEPGSPNSTRATATVRVHHVLKGELESDTQQFQNIRGLCGDPGPRMKTGEDLLLFMSWQSTRSLHGVGTDFRWFMTVYGSKVILTEDEAIQEEPWLQPERTVLGQREAFLRQLGERLEMPPEEIETMLLAADAAVDDDGSAWPLVAGLGAVAVTLFAITVYIRRPGRPQDEDEEP